MTGNVKVNPSSATSGGGGGTGFGALQHGERRIVEGGVAGPLHDARRQHVPDPVEDEADDDLSASASIAIRWIALVLVEMGGQLLLPGRRARAPRSRRFPATGATERGASGALSTVGVAVASAATDWSEGSAWIVAIFGSSSFGFFVSAGETTRSGSSVSVGTAFGKSVCSTTAFCSTTAGEAAEASVSGPDRQIGRIEPRRHQLDADFDAPARRDRRRHRPAA